MSSTIKVTEGAVIFAEDSDAESAYLIKSGSVEISVLRNDTRIILTTIGANQMFGEMALIDQSTRSATATALTPCELLVITPAMLAAQFEKLDGFMRFYVEFLIDRVRELSTRVHN